MRAVADCDGRQVEAAFVASPVQPECRDLQTLGFRPTWFSRYVVQPLLEGAEIGDQLPTLCFRQAGPGRHPVAKVPLA